MGKIFTVPLVVFNFSSSCSSHSGSIERNESENDKQRRKNLCYFILWEKVFLCSNSAALFRWGQIMQWISRAGAPDEKWANIKGASKVYHASWSCWPNFVQRAAWKVFLSIQISFLAQTKLLKSWRVKHSRNVPALHAMRCTWDVCRARLVALRARSLRTGWYLLHSDTQWYASWTADINRNDKWKNYANAKPIRGQ